MKRSLLRVLLTVVLVAVTPCYAISQIQGGRQYTKENPLVYEDAWDLWPYVFLNEHGEPEGFNVDVLKELFKDLKIPYVIKPRRPGDIATCYSNAEKAERELGWKAEFGIREMCADSWRWQAQNPNGNDD